MSTNRLSNTKAHALCCGVTGLSRIIGGIHVRPDNYGGQLLGTKVGKNAYYKVQAFFNSDANSDDDAPIRGNAGAGVTTSHTAALLDPKSATAEELLAACQAITASCGPRELRLLMEADDVAPRSAADLKVSRYGGLPFNFDDYGTIPAPPCFTCQGTPDGTGPAPPTPNNTQAGVQAKPFITNAASPPQLRLPPSPPPIAG